MFFLTGVATVQMCQTMISYCYELQVKELFSFVLQLTTQEVTIISVYIWQQGNHHHKCQVDAAAGV